MTPLWLRFFSELNIILERLLDSFSQIEPSRKKNVNYQFTSKCLTKTIYGFINPEQGQLNNVSRKAKEYSESKVPKAQRQGYNKESVELFFLKLSPLYPSIQPLQQLQLHYGSRSYCLQQLLQPARIP